MDRLLISRVHVVTAVAAMLFVGCQGRQETVPEIPAPTVAGQRVATSERPSVAPELGLHLENFPRVDGSTSTQPLLMMTACRILSCGFEWVHTESEDARQLWASPFDDMVQGRPADPKRCEAINRLVRTHGTGEAYVNLIRKRSDLIVAARPPSEDEQKLARAEGVELDVRPVALDAFVFLLNAANPVGMLSIEQIRDIDSGRITSWGQVGGPDAPIRPYQRPRNSGSQELMRTLVMKDRGMIAAPDLLLGALMSSPFLAIHKDVYGIGYSVYYYHEFMSPAADVKACAIGGIGPTAETIRRREYPLVTEVHVAVRKELPGGHPASRLRDWLLGPQGQGLVEQSGYVPIRPDADR